MGRVHESIVRPWRARVKRGFHRAKVWFSSPSDRGKPHADSEGRRVRRSPLMRYTRSTRAMSPIERIAGQVDQSEFVRGDGVLGEEISLFSLRSVAQGTAAEQARLPAEK